MTLYRPDYEKQNKIKKAKEFLESLTGEDANFLKEWIIEKDNIIEKLKKEQQEMMDVFKGIAKYTNKKPLICR